MLKSISTRRLLMLLGSRLTMECTGAAKVERSREPENPMMAEAAFGKT